MPKAIPTQRRGVFFKVVAWTLAVPVLCAAVVIGGAAPLYLLLPDAEPAAQAVVKPAAAPPAKAAARAPAPVEPVVDLASGAETIGPEAQEAREVAGLPGETSEELPDETLDSLPEASAEPDAATIVPTPRPDAPRSLAEASAPDAATAKPNEAGPSAREMPAEDETKPGATGGTRLASVAAAALPEASRRPAVAPAPVREGRRSFVRTAAKLRAAPQGAEIGVIRAGTEIVVGRCDRWCEVSADGRSGYVHVSLIGGARAPAAERRARDRREARPAERRGFEERRFEERRIARRPAPRSADPYARDGVGGYEEEEIYDRAYRRGEDPGWLMEDPYRPERGDWPERGDGYVEEDGRGRREEPPVLLYYEPYP